MEGKKPNQTKKNSKKCWDVQLTHLSQRETRATTTVNGNDVVKKNCVTKNKWVKNREKTPATRRSFTQSQPVKLKICERIMMRSNEQSEIGDDKKL